MDGLRLILLILGVVVVIAVYVLAREQSRRKVRRQARSAGREPALGLGADAERDDLDEGRLAEELARMEATLREEAQAPEPDVPAEPVIIASSRRRARPAAQQPTPAPAKPAEEKIVALHVMAPAHSPFRGKDLVRALGLAGLEYGDMQIYHRFLEVDGQACNAWFLANLVNPGTFDPERMEAFSTPGLSLFLRLPGDVGAARALDDMVATAQLLARELHGELRDENRSVLSRQGIEHLRSDVLEFERRLRVLQARA